MAAASLSAVTACSSNNGNSTSSSSSESASAGADSKNRVVALNTGQLDNLLTLGILPVGVAAAKGGELIPKFIRDAFGTQYDLDSIADCGLRQSPDVEAIAKLEPSLICANSRTDKEILKKLEDIAPVVTGEGGGENWKQDLVTVAVCRALVDAAPTTNVSKVAAVSA